MTKQTQQTNSLDNHKPALEELAEITNTIKRLEERKKELHSQVKPVLMDRGAIVCNGYSFECSSVEGRVTYDTKAMLADFGESTLEPYKKVGAPSARITIKVVNEL